MANLDALTIRSGWSDDWFVVCDENWRSPQWADIEGSWTEMIAMANAIETGTSFGAKRCAAYARDDGGYDVSSPRNSMSATKLTRDQALTLARNIRGVLAEEVERDRDAIETTGEAVRGG